MSSTGRAIIIGAGIGGLAAGIALQQAGWGVCVYERADTLREVGAGLSLWPNAIKALDRLGLAAALSDIGTPQRVGRITSWRGTILAETLGSTLEARFGAPTIIAHRADLQRILCAALGSDRLQLGAACTGFSQTADGVQMRFADGSEAQGDVLIGADGLHSVVRAQLFGGKSPRYAGYTAWRAVTAIPPDFWTPGVGFQAWGRGSQFGYVPIDDRRVYWFATKNAPAGQGDLAAGRKAELLARFHDWHRPIPQIIAATADEAILRNDIYDRPPLDHWSVGRVTLLGDAAHPTTPNLGQGACQALEDAVILGRTLRPHGEVAPALQRYQEQRLARTTRITEQSRSLGQAAQTANPLVGWLRDLVVRRLPAEAQLRQLAWILSYPV